MFGPIATATHIKSRYNSRSTTQLVQSVKNIADEMRATLRERLSDMTLRFSEKEKLIEYLREIDPDSDPA